MAPLKWVQKTGNKTKIYWPGEDDAATPKALVNLIMKEAVIDKETWMLYNITVVAKFGKLVIRHSAKHFFYRTNSYG